MEWQATVWKSPLPSLQMTLPMMQIRDTSWHLPEHMKNLRTLSIAGFSPC